MSKVTRVIGAVRWGEVLVLQGTPLFGALFSIGRLSEAKLAALALLLSGSICVVAHVFVFNDWAGIEGDLRDPHREPSAFVNRGIGRGEMAVLAAAFAMLAFALLAPLGWWPLGLGLLVMLFSALYSAPGLHFKGVPLANSALHLAGGMAHFLVGYSLFSALDARGVAMGAFFALTFAAGHLTHEARDWEGDRINGIRTNAVRFGRRACFIASFILFTVAYALLAWLALRSVIPRLILGASVLYPLQAYWTIETLRRGLSFESLGRMQARYRLCFMMIGAIIVVALLPSLMT